MALAKALKKKKTDPLIRQAQLEAKVRYGPERSALRGLAQQAYQTLVTGAKIDRGVAEGIIAAAQQAAPQIVAAYQQAGATADGAREQFQADIGHIGAAADPYKAAAAKESAAAVARIGIASAGAQTEIANRQVQAEQGRAFSTQQRARTYQTDIGKVNTRLTDLAQEEGAFIEATHGKLVAAKEKAAEQARQDAIDQAYKEGQLAISQGNLDVAQGQLGVAQQRADQAPGGPNAPKKPKKGGLTSGQRNTVINQVNGATAWARRLLTGGASQSAVRAALIAGRPADKKKGTPKIPAYAPDYVNSGLDLAIWGRLSPSNTSRLKNRGVKLPSEWTGAGYKFPKAYGNAKV